MHVSMLFDLGSKINAIYSTFAKELGLPIRPIDVGAQKIDGTILDTFGIVVAVFSVADKANQVKFFEKTFLVANISPEVVFEMLFFTLSGVDIDFLGWEIRWRTYTTKKFLPTTRCIELVGKKEFAAAMLDPEHKIYLVYVGLVSFIVLLSSSLLDVHLFRRPQIAGLIAKKAFTKVPIKYLDFVDIFSLDLASELFEHTWIKNHAIELINGQQPSYGPIYYLGPVELETLKAYIETNPANRFIRLSKSPASTFILFDQKSNGLFWLYVDYQELNNLMIKNRYLLSLIGELLNRLGRTKRFIQLNFTSAYHQMRIREGDE